MRKRRTWWQRPSPFRISSLGERAFEIRAGRAAGRRGEVETQWFARHRSTPVTEIPAHWPEEYQADRREADRVHREQPKHRADRAARVQAPLAVGAMGGEGTGRAADLAAGSVRGAVAVVRAGRAAAADDGEPAGGPAARRRRRRVGGPAVRGAGRRPVRRAQRDHRRRARPVPGRATGTRARACSSGRNGSRPGRCSARRTAPASGWTSRCRRSTPPPTSGRPRTGGTAASSTCPRSGSSPTPARAQDSDGSLLLGWAGWDHREQAQALTTLIETALDRRRLGHRTADPAACRAGRGHAVGPPVARRDRPRLRPEPRRCAGRLPHSSARIPFPHRGGPPHVEPGSGGAAWPPAHRLNRHVGRPRRSPHRPPNALRMDGSGCLE